jgi:uncharacterized membrane protein YphA (DoxX/SURF4 family)
VNTHFRKLASLAVRLIAAGIFLYAGWQKITVPEQFADNIAAYQILPLSIINPMALAFPPLEIMVGFLLLVGWRRRLAAFSALILISIFTVALASAIARGLVIDCGCFGASAPSKSHLSFALIRDLAMCAGLLYLYVSEIGSTSKIVTPSTPTQVAPSGSEEPGI